MKDLKGTDLEEGFGMVGKKFFFMHTDLDSRSKLVYCFLSTFGDRIYPSREKIARACSMNLKTVDKCLKALIRAGVLIKSTSKKDNNGRFTSVSYSICHSLAGIEKNRNDALSSKALADGALAHGAPSYGAPSHGAPSHGTIIDMSQKRQYIKRQEGKEGTSSDIFQDIIDSAGGI